MIAILACVLFVSADGKLPHLAEVKLTHPGKDVGLLRAVDAEPG
ncbi:MAG: hypothetical protein FD144_5832, partial [Rhodospirillaceae bacterium]